MNRKLKNTIALLVIFLLIAAAGLIYIFAYIESDIEEKKKRIDELNLNAYNTEELLNQLNTLNNRVAELDSILALRKYNIPVKIQQSRFYDFVNKISFRFAPDSYVNVEYEESFSEQHYNYFTYKVSGVAYFNEFFKLVYAIEQSKELKKVQNCILDDNVEVDEDGIPHYKVSFNFTVEVYFSDNDRFASSRIVENNLVPNYIYDVFYPLIRNEIPENVDNLLDVQTAQLLALVPDGAFLSDASGRSYVLWEGDQVYLGYLTQIDYTANEVNFILNKGGIIEKVTLTLTTENNLSE